ncbi:alpha/beta hydrolase fold protein [Reticulomyxa filosa]|uniref:Alpha/beta hydrolase fold protein n=1 Tax=Reticulomyxa filosa TaxID=46433 RepID=X6MVB1_RETFI|nr:alpha/beta hydrolase fold protein [Reticulomyxa filosa]|eukprot:ETO17372.1 alpha/beta hydrolase fold protein [Reticulomyxa filosa]
MASTRLPNEEKEFIAASKEENPSCLLKNMKTLFWFGAILGIAGYVLVVWLPQNYFYIGWENVPELPGLEEKWVSTLDKDVKLQSITFSSEDGQCSGDLYEPASEKSKYKNTKGEFPIIIMGHGIGSTRDQGLQRFAEKFANQGLAVLAFDYRTYGRSPGLPRHYLSPTRHVQDFKNAVAYVQSLSFVDKKRIVLWGSRFTFSKKKKLHIPENSWIFFIFIFFHIFLKISYGGGHVIKAASDLPSLAAVISQVPFMGNTPHESKLDEMKKRGLKVIGLGLLGSISANIRHWLGMPEIYGPIYAHQSTQPFRLAMNYWELIGEPQESWLEKHPKNRPNDWKNGALIRPLFDVLTYRPVASVEKISPNTKVLYIAAKKDKLCPMERVQYALKKTPHAEMALLDCGHFDVYAGESFEQNIRAQLHFLEKILLP